MENYSKLDKVQVKSMKSEKILAALERSISRNRLAKYLAETGDALGPALEIYEYNTKLSEAFYSPLQAFEICLRNHLNDAISNKYGSNWMVTGAAELADTHDAEILDARRNLREDGKRDDATNIVAALRFRFWVGLLATRYDASLWRGCLFKAFPKGTNRKKVHGRANAIRRFRNRIAHHEPIYNRSPDQIYHEVIEAISWLCPDTADWTKSHSRVLDVYDSHCGS